MKSNFFFSIGIIALFAFFSCTKENVEQKDTRSVVLKAASAVTYGTNLAKNAWTTVPPENISLNGYTYNKGIIKAQLTTINNGSFEIEISRIDGGILLSDGTAYVKAGSVVGSISGSASFLASAKTVKVKFNATFTTGIVNFYPVIVSKNGTRTFTSPILVYSNPVYTATSSSSTNGTVLGIFNGVEIKSSGGSNLSSSWQCTEFCCRYYSQVYGIKIPQISAVKFDISQPLLRRFPNGGIMPPQSGDILVFSGGPGPSGLGHVMIVTEVTSTFIRVAHQNSGNAAPIGFSYKISNNYLDATSLGGSYKCLSWLRP